MLIVILIQLDAVGKRQATRQLSRNGTIHKNLEGTGTDSIGVNVHDLKSVLAELSQNWPQ
jgi:hypothetical protein